MRILKIDLPRISIKGRGELEINGDIPFVWIDNVKNMLTALVLSNSKFDTKTNILPKNIISAVLLYYCCAGLYKENMEGNKLKNINFDKISIILSHKPNGKKEIENNLSEFTFSIQREKAQNYIYNIINEYYSDEPAELLPFEIITKKKNYEFFLNILNDESIDKNSEYKFFLNERIEEEKNSYIKFKQQPTPITLLNFHIADSAYDKTLHRIKPIIDSIIT